MFPIISANDIHKLSVNKVIGLDSDRILTVSGDKSAKIWNLKKFSEEYQLTNTVELNEHKYAVFGCAVSQNYIATCSTDGYCIIYDRRNYTQIKKFKHCDENSLRVCLFSDDQSLLVTGDDKDGNIYIWNISNMKEVEVMTVINNTICNEGYLTSIALHSSNELIISVFTNGRFHLHETYYNRKFATKKTIPSQYSAIVNSQLSIIDRPITKVNDIHELGCTHVKFVPLKTDSITKTIVTSGFDNKLYRWIIKKNGKTGVTSLTKMGQFVGHESSVMEFDLFNPNEDKKALSDYILISCSMDKSLILWNLVNCQMLRKLNELHPRMINSVCFLPRSINGPIFGVSVCAEAQMHIVQIVLEDLKEQKQFSETTCVDCSVAPMVKLAPVPPRYWSKMPSDMVCPITMEPFQDPVVASDGFTYERNGIMTWFKQGNTISPLTGEPLSSTQLVFNTTLRKLIEDKVKELQ
ncbi:hypothetical protein SNEBB_004654 [Seison nebaliae]|nr:hypothetical protein SNEBB_004654 [Seison nebaliae]